MLTPLLAEVADKEPSLTAIWVLSMVLCLGTLLLAKIRRWGWLPAIMLAATSAYTAYAWLRDPHEGPALVRELGRNYVVQAWVAGLLPSGVLVYVLLLRWKRP